MAAARIENGPVLEVVIQCANDADPSNVSVTMDSLKTQIYGRWRAWRLQGGIEDRRNWMLLGTGPAIDASVENGISWSIHLHAGTMLWTDALFEVATEILIAPVARTIGFHADQYIGEECSARCQNAADLIIAQKLDTKTPESIRLDGEHPDTIISKVLATLPPTGIFPAEGKSDIVLSPILNKAPLQLIDRKAIARILIIKLDHIGDAVLNIPIIRRVREWFPEADVTLLAASWNEQLLREQLQTCGTVQRVISFDFFHEVSGRGWLQLKPEEVRQLVDRLGPFRFDLAIDLRREGDTRGILRAIPARWKIAYGMEDSSSILGINRTLSSPAQEGSLTITRQMHLLLDAYLNPDNSLLSENVLLPVSQNGNHGIGDTGQWTIGFSPGCGDDLRIWPARHYAETADLLSERLNARTLWFGAAREEPLISTILKTMKHRDEAVSLAGGLDLTEFSQAVRHCHLFIGNTTGPTHIAAASGVPTLNIFAGQVSAFEWAPIGPAPFVIRVKTLCAPCQRLGGQCEYGMKCLTAITPAAATRAACQILLGVHGSIDAQPRNILK